MNNLNISRKTWTTLIVLAIVAAIVYVVIEIFSSLEYSGTTSEQRPLSKQVAIEQATQFAEQQTGLKVIKAEAYHYSDKDYTGYLAKYELGKEHQDKIDKFLPIDQYRVNLLFPNKILGSVDRNLYSGNIIGWEFNLDGTVAEQTDSYREIEAALSKFGFPIDQGTHIQAYNRIDKAEGLSAMNRSADVKVGYYVTNDHLKIKDAIFQYDTAVIQYNDKLIVSTLKPTFDVPSDYLKLVDRQDLYATIWTYAVYFLFTFVLGILAIVYAILYRKYTSFKYGAWLTAIATIISLVLNIAMFKSQFGLEGEMLSVAEPAIKVFFVFITAVSLIAGAVGYYFSFVAGDGLWKAQGFRLWPRFRDNDYGQHVWNSMKLGYLLAVIGLGLQGVIFLALSLLIGTWTANDTSQSILNFDYMWFYPAAAWFAAISEEVVYRFFGVGILRRWFKNTWLAALIPTIVWAAGHTLYPFYPSSTRVIELIIIGYFCTWVMIRFGFIAGIFVHATFDTILMSMSLIFYGETFDVISGWIFIVLPFLIALVIRWLHKVVHRKKDTENFNRPQYPHATP